jgi:membrane protein YdbS with pleckstrin-like domain
MGERPLNHRFGTWKSTLFLALLWVNFVALWARVYWITTAKDVTDSINSLGVLISLYGLVITLWIFHNVRIYRKKGPRTSARIVNVGNTYDVLNRRIARRANVMADQEITVEIVGSTKFFVHNAPADPERSREAEVFIR